MKAKFILIFSILGLMMAVTTLAYGADQLTVSREGTLTVSKKNKSRAVILFNSKIIDEEQPLIDKENSKLKELAAILAITDDAAKRKVLASEMNTVISKIIKLEDDRVVKHNNNLANVIELAHVFRDITDTNRKSEKFIKLNQKLRQALLDESAFLEKLLVSEELSFDVHTAVSSNIKEASQQIRLYVSVVSEVVQEEKIYTSRMQ